MEQLKNKRSVIKNSITRIFTYCNSVGVTEDGINARMDKLNEYFTNFEQIQEEIEASSMTSEQAATEKKVRESDEEKYYAVKAMLHRIQRNETNETTFETPNSQFTTAMESIVRNQNTLSEIVTRITESTTSTPVNNHLQSTSSEITRLPRIQLPVFDGTVTNWLRFRDLFEATVHNKQSLCNIEKLEYLQCHLKGDALCIIKHLAPSNENYELAWQLVKNKFNDYAQIKKSYLQLLFDQPSIKSTAVSEFKRFVNNINEGINALKSLNEAVDQWDLVLLFHLERKLDTESQILWYRTANSKRSFVTFMDFIVQRLRELELYQTNKLLGQPTKGKYNVHTSTVTTCICCDKAHPIYTCSQFKLLPVKERRKMVQNKQLCYNCLNSGHIARDCTRSVCKECKQKHNTLLHISSPVTSNHLPTIIEQPHTIELTAIEKRTAADIANQTSYVTYNNMQSNKYRYILLPTAMIDIVDNNQSIRQCRALLDSGSQGSLITESCVQRLHLKRQYNKTFIHGVGNAAKCYSKGKVTLNIRSLNDNKTQITTNALCMSKLTQWLPSISLSKENLNYFNNLQLADPKYNTPAPIDIILGADVFAQCCLFEKIIHPSGSPTALKTIFGWVFMGEIQCEYINTISTHFVSINLDEQLQSFWQLEDVSTKQIQLSKEDEKAERYYTETTQQNKEGRYIVRLPLKNKEIDIGESKNNAVQRLYALEKKMKTNQELEIKYKEFMAEYVRLNHMEVIHQTPIDKPICYLPHHAIFKPSSTTSKLRVVFDASNKTSNGKSLIDNLLIGPKIQNDIFNMLINFRKFEIACVADIEKMYRQILVNNEDKLMQCILWRNNQHEEIKTYTLNTLTYGTASAPFLAIRTLLEIANKHAQSHPKISHIIKNNFYVDDLLYCCENIEEAIDITQELRTILSRSGLHLRKWASNSSMLLINIDKKDRADHFDANIQSSSSHTLGLKWDKKSDKFKYSNIDYSTQNVITKRLVLSEISKLYDPMGWVAPVIIKMKIFIQRLWLAGVNWDEQLPQHLREKWTILRKNIDELNKVRINRWCHLSYISKIELHGFCDASQEAYAAAVYIKANNNGEIVTHLLAAKTRVAPIKQISIPRLELCGAHLLVNLMSKIFKNFSNSEIVMHGWTDSTIVLSWLSDHPCNWKTFIANRTSEIINIIPSHKWHHIQSKHNPADVATRGNNPITLNSDYMWWHGPEEIRLNKYPSNDKIVPINIERKNKKPLIVNTIIQQTNDIIKRYSNFTKLLRTTALIKRFIYNCKNNKQSRKIGFVTSEELKYAEISMLRIVQQNSFSNEIKIITSNNQLPPKNKLSSLAPFVDNEGILRVGGRINNANISFNQKHPIILHSQHHFTKLLVRYYHIKHCHANKRLLFYIIHLKFWIPSALPIIKKCIYTCTTCIRFKGKTLQQQMGNLPESRLIPAPTFSKVGIDFAGPVQVISWKGRGNKIYKSWIAIFVCLVTKAIHIELVSELTSYAFIAALRRFVARRGIPNHIYSDNGTNFLGTNNYLKDLYKFWNNPTNQDNIMRHLTDHEIHWHFSPPFAPHFGGIWEAGVKSIKFHLKRVLKDAHPTFEELQTLLCQIESCLNSRPLCIKYEGDTDPLTPAHFILLRPMTALQDENCYTLKENRLNRWQYIQRLVHQFWKKWHVEYLNQLQQRNKWNSVKMNIAINDVVIIKDDNNPPSQWIIGKVAEIHAGDDGLIRVVTLKTKNGYVKRPITKLCPLYQEI